jgi:hypothetical protein
MRNDTTKGTKDTKAITARAVPGGRPLRLRPGRRFVAPGTAGAPGVTA